MKELFIIRHAKSSWKDSSMRDFDRPLNDRGKKDAPNMGDRLMMKNIKPDLIVSSPANRAKTTANIIAEKVQYGSDKIQYNADIYGASVAEMIKLINRLDDRHQRVFLFGHNPTFTELAEELSNEHFGNLPTCGIVGLQFEFDSWELISSGTGDLLMYDYPKNQK